MWRVLHHVGVGIGIVGIIPIGFMALVVYQEARSARQWELFHNVMKEHEKRDLRRYTVRELKEVVGRSPSREWTSEQVETLDAKYQQRCTDSQKRWDELNKLAQQHKRDNPEKYPGMLQHVAFGAPDIFLVGRQTQTDQMTSYYNAFKHVEKNPDPDPEFREWIDAEIQRHDEALASAIRVVDSEKTG